MPNNLTVDNIKIGSSNIRNQIVATFVAKGLIHYRGLVSGITHALHAWKYIDFIDDREKCTFTAIIHRKFINEYKTSIDSRHGATACGVCSCRAATVREASSHWSNERREVGSSRLELDQLDAMRRMSGDDRKTGVWRGGHGGALAIGLTSWL